MGQHGVEPALCVPGFGMKVDNLVRGAFSSAVRGDWRSMGVTLREKRMMAFINDVTDKPHWERKVFDDDIVEKWRAEGDVRPDSLGGDVVLSERMFDFCIQELRDKAAVFKETGLVTIFDAELAIVKSDTAVSDSIRDALVEGAKVLEDVPDHLKDWHPRSNNMVLDLVHPSLFPVTYGLTKVIPDEKVPLDGCMTYIGKGTTIDLFTPPYLSPVVNQFSSMNNPSPWGSFQWLPTDIELSDSGAKIMGYINNLHPKKHRGLYGVLEKIVAAAVPLWEEALDESREGGLRIQLHDTGLDDWTYPEGLKYRIPGVEEGPKAYYDPIKRVLGSEYDPDDPYEWEYETHYTDWVDEHRILEYREPRNYKPQAELKEDSRTSSGKDYAGIRLQEEPSGLQVIFKLANIHLTPEKPTYEGGSWHIEGGLNELICASAIYYFDQENITDSHLAFRQALDWEKIMMIPEQNEYESLEAYLGVEQEGPAVQTLGQVLTREGRLIAFPNFIQHQVQPFSLQDSTKSGYRKILAMFLIDPGRRVLSTSNVPPQRRDWWAEELHAQGALHGRLPTELVDYTIGLVDEFPISWEKAVEMREKLMDQRSSANENISREMLDETFSFCEH